MAFGLSASALASALSPARTQDDGFALSPDTLAALRSTLLNPGPADPGGAAPANPPGAPFGLSPVAYQQPASGGPGGGQAAGYADRVGGAESNGNATARNPRSSATGYGQFIDGTWLDMMGKYRPDLAGSLPREQLLNLRNDPALSREMIQHYGDENGARLRAAGLPDNDGTRYLSHFAGPKGARAVLSADPSSPASQVLEAGQVAANPFVRSMTAGQLADWAAKKVGGAAPAMTMPGGSARPAGFGLSGPTQGSGTGTSLPSGGATMTMPGVDADGAQPGFLDAMRSLGGMSGETSADKGGQKQGDGGSILRQPAPQRRPFAFMQFPGLTGMGKTR